MSWNKVSFEEYEKRVKEKFGGKIEVSEDSFTRMHGKVDVWCKKHNERFSRECRSLLRSYGCRECKKDAYKERSLNTEDFLKRAREVHGDTYGYDKVFCQGVETKVKIWCKIHEKYFKQSASKHLIGEGCKSCAQDYIATLFKSNTKDFIEKAVGIHGDKFDYSEVGYHNSATPVKLWCRFHEFHFLQTPYGHLKSKYGCPKCNKENGSSWGRKGVYKTDRESNLYVVEMMSEEDSFIKVGLSVDPSDRWKRMNKLEQVNFIKPIMTLTAPANYLSKMENNLLFHTKLKRFFIEGWSWAGRTECFDITEKGNILKEIAKYQEEHPLEEEDNGQ